MKIMRGYITGICICLIGMSLTMTSILANSAQTQWTGTDSTGAIVLEKDSPIIVEKELLTFDIQEFPESYYRESKDFISYSTKVTAEYTFYNPADYTVTATLAFPFGGTADYAFIYDYENDNYLLNLDTEKYDITVDDEVINKQLRHTLMYYGWQFELEEDLAKLHDGFMEDSFYYPDQPVTKYTYKAKDVDKKEHNVATAAFVLSLDGTETKVYMENQSGGSTEDNGVLLSTWVDLDEEFSVYAIGEPFTENVDWKFYHNGACEEEIDGIMELISTELLTLKDFALSEYHSESGILDYDWYNAIVTSLKYHEWTNGAIHSGEVDLDLSNLLMRWYQYEITLEPKQRIVNTVVAPIYPAINSNYEPAIYEYTYLLSPAKTWKEFGNLDIVVNTPYYMIKSGMEGFNYNNPGYELHFTGLPEGELTFTLCEDANPIAPSYNNPFVGITLGCGVIVIIAIVIIYRKKK